MQLRGCPPNAWRGPAGGPDPSIKYTKRQTHERGLGSIVNPATMLLGRQTTFPYNPDNFVPLMSKHGGGDGTPRAQPRGMPTGFSVPGGPGWYRNMQAQVATLPAPEMAPRGTYPYFHPMPSSSSSSSRTSDVDDDLLQDPSVSDFVTHCHGYTAGTLDESYFLSTYGPMLDAGEIATLRQLRRYTLQRANQASSRQGSSSATTGSGLAGGAVQGGGARSKTVKFSDGKTVTFSSNKVKVTGGALGDGETAAEAAAATVTAPAADPPPPPPPQPSAAAEEEAPKEKEAESESDSETPLSDLFPGVAPTPAAAPAAADGTGAPPPPPAAAAQQPTENPAALAHPTLAPAVGFPSREEPLIGSGVAGDASAAAAAAAAPRVAGEKRKRPMTAKQEARVALVRAFMEAKGIKSYIEANKTVGDWKP